MGFEKKRSARFFDIRKFKLPLMNFVEIQNRHLDWVPSGRSKVAHILRFDHFLVILLFYLYRLRLPKADYIYFVLKAFCAKPILACDGLEGASLESLTVGHSIAQWSRRRAPSPDSPQGVD